MIFFTFLISGVIVGILLTLKVIEIRTGKSVMILDLISKGDHRLRELSHVSAHKYSELKEDTHFFVTKQLPFRTKNWINKMQIILKDRTEDHIGNIRNSRFLKKKDGISEFLKNVSETEKGGEINDTLEVPENTYSQNVEDAVK